MKRFLCAILVLSVLVFAGCSGSGASGSASAAAAEAGKPQFTLKLAHLYADGHFTTMSCEKFKNDVNERSKGEILVEVYPNNTLGEEAQVYDGVRTGTIEMGVCGVVMQADTPLITVLQMPFLFKNEDHVQAVCTGPIGAEIAGALSHVGVKCFPIGTSGFRVLISNKKVEKIADMKGLKLRMPPSENMVKIGSAMGASTMAMPMGEVFSALEQNVIDAADNPYAALRAAGWHEVTKYAIDTNHVFTPDELIINLNLYNSMSKEQQAIMDACGVDYAAYNWSLVKEGTKKDMEFIGQHCTLIIPDEQFKADLRKATAGIYEEFYQKVPEARAIVQRINDMASQY